MSGLGLLDGATPKPPLGAAGVPAWRSRSAEELLAALEPLLPAAGITRVANVTGLDVIGIPVWQAIRPNSRGLAVAQGKGLTHALARASAVMESIESWHAERAAVPCVVESVAGLAPTGRVIDPDALPRDANGTYHPHAPLPFCSATDIATGRDWWIPFELVHTNMVLPLVAGSGTFARTSNGLASGATLVEAVLHGLCEVIERDAHAVWHVRHPGRASATRIDPATIADPAATDLLGRYEAAGLQVFLWDLTADTGVPCTKAIVWDPTADLDLNPLGAAGGYGCHPDPRIAMVRALTEAAQSRLTAIAGSRDDQTRGRQALVQSGEAFSFWREVATDPTPRGWDHPLPGTTTVEDDLRAVLASLRAAGLPQVLVVDLSRDDWPVHVARVVVPGAEGAHTTPAYTPGRRAHAAFAAAAHPGGEEP